MSVHKFIQDRNLKIKEAWKLVRADKSKNRDERLQFVAKQFQVSPSTVHNAVYRTKINKA
ncbi:IS630 transposase-related protein [Flavobacterium mesophilum]|uniref:IS630 transposase-related protein n=1 Tax=Flavobacterium mesophilum TaxID=3143495 RepID=UPI0031D87109